jgi:hypothetical protein
MGIHLYWIEKCSKLRIKRSGEDFRGMKAPLCAVDEGSWVTVHVVITPSDEGSLSIKIASASGGEVSKMFCHPHFSHLSLAIIAGLGNATTVIDPIT